MLFKYWFRFWLKRPHNIFKWRCRTHFKNELMVEWYIQFLQSSSWMMCLEISQSNGTSTMQFTCWTLIFYAKCLKRSSVFILWPHLHMHHLWSSWEPWRNPYCRFMLNLHIALLIEYHYLFVSVSLWNPASAHGIVRTMKKSFFVCTLCSLQAIIPCRWRSAATVASSAIISVGCATLV